MVKERFEASEFAQIPGNVHEIDCQTDYTTNGKKIDMDALVAAKGSFKKAVFGHWASATALPYPDAWFDCYVSNLCLMLVDDHEDADGGCGEDVGWEQQVPATVIHAAGCGRCRCCWLMR